MRSEPLSQHDFIKECRACKNPVGKPVLSLGDVPVMSMGDKSTFSAPLELVYCINCTLLQLSHTVDKELLFREYYYKSGVSITIRTDLESIVKGAVSRVELKTGDVVVDIGANDGTLLSFYPRHLHKVGFEPAQNLFKEALEHGEIYNEFFSADALNAHHGHTKIITAISMFYDLDDPNTFLADVKKILAPDGIFVIQQNYLPAMLRNNAFDNIVHEHLEYYSVTSLNDLLERHELGIEDVEFNDVNGGSFRVYVRHQKWLADHIRLGMSVGDFLARYPVRFPHIGQSVIKALEDEKGIGLDKIQIYKEFASKVEVVSHKLRRLLKGINDEGKLVYLAGASTRGNTLLNVAGISEFIKFAVERNPAKHGQTYNGILVVSEKFAEEFPPDYYLILPWHFASEFFMREQPYLRKGGKLIFPLPKPAIVEVEEL